MTKQELRNRAADYLIGINDYYNKPWLIPALVSHLQRETGESDQIIRQVVRNFFSTIELPRRNPLP